MIGEPIFLCISNPRDLVESFVDALDGLATQSKAQMILRFLEIETSVRIKHNQIVSFLNQLRCHNEPVMEIEDGCIKEKEHDVSTQYLQTQRNQRSSLQNLLDRYCNVLQVFGFNSAKYDMNLKKLFTGSPH